MDLFTRTNDILEIVKRDSTGSFVFAAEHCFAIKGHGAVFTGTVLKGSAKLGDSGIILLIFFKL